MELAETVPTRRPGWVWAISIFFVLSAGWTLLSFVMVSSGAVPLNAAQIAYFDSLTALDYASTVVLGLVSISAAVAIFLLRKAAFYLFTFGLAANVSLTIWHIATKGWVAAVGGSGLIGAAIGLGLLFAVCAYSWRLTQRGVLR